MPHQPHRFAARSLAPLAIAAALSMAACGGGSSSGTGETAQGTGVSTAASFPVGLAVGSPADVGGASVLSAAAPSGWQIALDWSRAAWQALTHGDGRQLARLAALAMPGSLAHADAGGAPELVEAADLIRKALEGDTSIDLAGLLDLAGLFGVGVNNAACYGPQVAYANHQDGPMGTGSGTLPSGDVGLWLATDAPSGQPCVVAQLRKRITSAKRQGLQGLLMAATMRRTVAASSSLAMPAAGGSTDLTAAYAASLALLLPSASITVETATIALDSAGTYTYRLVLSHGSGANAKRGEMLLRHLPGASSSSYSGTLQVAGFVLDNDAAFGCDDQIDSGTGLYQTARVSTLKYSRNDATIQFGSRSAQYCGHPSAGAGSDDAAQVASFTVDHQLDPTAKISGSSRGGTLGWRGNFTRYAGDFDKDSAAGTFLLAWQAGTGDGQSRALAATGTYNSATGVRSVDGYYAYADEISTTTGALQGMICNWAGPGNSHATNTLFQSQSASLASGATTFALASSLITYAPTVSCSSTTTEFDANGDGTLGAGEGAGTTAALDGLTGGRASVDAELRSRGWSAPTLF